MKALLSIAVAFGLSSCGPSAFPEPQRPDVLQAEQRWPGTKLLELQTGRTLYLGRCGSCHRPFEPQEVAAEDWRHEIAGMQEQAKLNDAQSDLIAKYLIVMSERSMRQ